MSCSINAKKKKKATRPRRARREYGIGDFLSWLHSDGGLRRAVKKVQREEQLFLKFDPTGKPVN